jgi:hypothetical protein
MLAFCDYIAFRTQKFFGEITEQGDTYLKNVSKVEFDLSEAGSFLSTKKTMFVTDHSGKQYRLTVEEVKG